MKEYNALEEESKDKVNDGDSLEKEQLEAELAKIMDEDDDDSSDDQASNEIEHKPDEIEKEIET